MKMIIMRGIPGSGKSTLAKKLIEDDPMLMAPNVVICSTDDYWIRPDGAYDWNYKRIKEAHQWNQDRVRANLSAGLNVIVDNTNVQIQHMLPYTAMADEFGAEVEYVHAHRKGLTAEQVFRFAERNTHGVPLKTVISMYENFELID